MPLSTQSHKNWHELLSFVEISIFSFPLAPFWKLERNATVSHSYLSPRPKIKVFFSEKKHKVAFQKQKKVKQNHSTVSSDCYGEKTIHPSSSPACCVQEQCGSRFLGCVGSRVSVYFTAACHFRDKVFVYQHAMTNETGEENARRRMCLIPGGGSLSSTSPRLFLLLPLSAPRMKL